MKREKNHLLKQLKIVMLYVRKDLKLTDLQLCKLWFLCLYKNYDIPKKLSDIPAELLESVKLIKTPPYKLSAKEIFKAGESWFVGDGYGNIMYSPNRCNKDFLDYSDGVIPIAEKYKVEIGEE